MNKVVFDLNRFKEGRFYVYCSNSKEAKVFLDYLTKLGFRWYGSGDSANQNFIRESFYSCITDPDFGRIGLAWSSGNYFQDEELICFTDLIIPSCEIEKLDGIDKGW